MFIPPTEEEVRAYCQERNNQINPEQFVNYYESIGWKVGKNKMVSWKAAIRTWEIKQRSQVQQFPKNIIITNPNL